MKVCKACGVEKDTSLFRKCSKMKDGFNTNCKACDAISDKAYRDRNKDRINANQRRRTAENPEEKHEAYERWKKKNPYYYSKRTVENPAVRKRQQDGRSIRNAKELARIDNDINDLMDELVQDPEIKALIMAIEK